MAKDKQTDKVPAHNDDAESEKDPEKCVNADNASHNLDAQIDDQSGPPSRDVGEADFAAEAHGFTAFEKTGQGSSYRGGALDEHSDDEAEDDDDND